MGAGVGEVVGAEGAAGGAVAVTVVLGAMAGAGGLTVSAAGGVVLAS